ncbi:unnamed protein product (macronuclear) [Paramecium tetraurelia]|uniref:non-specific serine/threonine protein kinase n=1 Tax=Paramecium tetraurelia TaxID=5888 RepID=A0BH97_PARTE|nr:uncharacterized protein GSPATT00028949001 [Paramecium tetraurelia]CAK57914.1 unnamed protein product [Paramecium tetraurelia]|eukprot:XP_001425312.1 hypothetical protein (macronuclear) [Paramecium tetraurelia strain d4-2]
MLIDIQQPEICCFVCQIKVVELLRCSQFKSLYYCSKNAKSKDWKQHKSICSEIQLQLQREKQRAERRYKGRKILKTLLIFRLSYRENFLQSFGLGILKPINFLLQSRLIKEGLPKQTRRKIYSWKNIVQANLLTALMLLIFYSTFQDAENLYMQMQYVEGGELQPLVKNFGAQAFPLCLYYITELIKAINSIHKLGTVHRDIKSENLLLTQEKQINLIDYLVLQEI